MPSGRRRHEDPWSVGPRRLAHHDVEVKTYTSTKLDNGPASHRSGAETRRPAREILAGTVRIRLNERRFDI